MVAQTPQERTADGSRGNTDSVPAAVVKRLYIGGLKSGVSSMELEGRFKTFGKVLSIEISSKISPEGTGFAHVSLETTPSALGKCLSLYNGTKWKGMQLRVEEAKQHYLTRLKREWAEIETNSDPKPSISKKKKKRTAITEADDMTLVSDRNVKKGRKGWKVSRFGRAVAVFHVRDPLTGKRKAIDPSFYKNSLKRLDGFAQTTPVAQLSWPSSDYEPPRKQIQHEAEEIEEIVKGGLFDSSDDEADILEKFDHDGNEVQFDSSADDATSDSDDEEADFHTVPVLPSTTSALQIASADQMRKKAGQLPASLLDSDDDDELPPALIKRQGRREIGGIDAQAEKRLAKERVGLLGLAHTVIGWDMSEPNSANQTNVVDFADSDADGESNDAHVIALQTSDVADSTSDGLHSHTHFERQSDSDNESIEEEVLNVGSDGEASSKSTEEVEGSLEQTELQINGANEVSSESDSVSTISSGSLAASIDESRDDDVMSSDTESQSDAHSPVILPTSSTTTDSEDRLPATLWADTLSSDASSDVMSNARMADREREISSDDSSDTGDTSSGTLSDSTSEAEELGEPEEQPEAAAMDVDQVPECMDSNIEAEQHSSGSRHFVVNTNLRSLVSDNVGDGSFSLFGIPPASGQSDVAPAPLFNFAGMPTEETILQPAANNADQHDKAELARSLGTSKMFFLHLDDPSLSHRSKYAPDGTFMRHESVESITSKWEEVREDLTHEFKSKHKLAARKKEKLRRQRPKAS
ncbi:nucleolar protein 8 [Gaertneriomyces sp. JEL0708]|nr:nucleolar protein 8 [Gaertneriomyces sp. JEL0708]